MEKEVLNPWKVLEKEALNLSIMVYLYNLTGNRGFYSYVCFEKEPVKILCKITTF